MLASRSIENQKPGDVFRRFAELSKSGIVTLVLISVVGGFLGGQSFEASFDWARLFQTFLGVLFLASGSSALNQLQEIEIDRKMPRTANRPLPSGRISKPEALWFILFSVTLGLILLFNLDWMVGVLGVLAVVSYNGLYTLWWKKKMAFGAVPGAIPGALPILIGHVAASRNIARPDGWFFFALLFFWQMPHFWSLAIRYREDYARGGFPTLPVARDEKTTRFHITLWSLAYVGAAIVGTLFLKTHRTYFFVTFAMSAKVLWELRGFLKNPDEKRAWLRFFLWINFSLIVYILGAVIDLYSVYLIPLFTR